MKYRQYLSTPIILNTIIFIAGLLWIITTKFKEYEPYIVALTAISNALYKICSIYRINNIIEFANQKIKYEKIKNKFRDIPRISVLGLPSAGKTTLIENLVHFDNLNTATQEKSAYLLELATTKHRFAFILDDRGNSQLNQNSLLCDGKYILLLIDHNQSETDNEYIVDRTKRTKTLVEGLILKLLETNKNPDCIFIIINKIDLIENTEVVITMEKLAIEIQNKFETDIHKKIPIYIYKHSNKSSKSINTIYRELVNRINYD